MSIKIRSFALTEALISAAPNTGGVFALWQNGGVIYLGKASAGGQTIRKALGEQFEGRKWNVPVLTRCCWEVVEDADKRHRELLHEFEAAHRCLPLWNDPQRLPT
jgi:hypothetical protein